MSQRIFSATKAPVFNRGCPPDSFLEELVAWGSYAPDDIFAVNRARHDIMDAIKLELGPWESPDHRRAALMEAMRVLAGFESGWNWTEGVDTTNPNSNTSETEEAGIFQISYNSRAFGQDLQDMLKTEAINSGPKFQAVTKFDHVFALDYAARLLRHTTFHNGPLYRDRGGFPTAKLRDPEQSVYPWLNRDAVAEFTALMQ